MKSVNFSCREGCPNYVELRYESDRTATGARLCCYVPKNPVVSGDDAFIVIYNTQSDAQSGYYGFTLEYRSGTNPCQEVREMMQLATN